MSRFSRGLCEDFGSKNGVLKRIALYYSRKVRVFLLEKKSLSRMPPVGRVTEVNFLILIREIEDSSGFLVCCRGGKVRFMSRFSRGLCEDFGFGTPKIGSDPPRIRGFY